MFNFTTEYIYIYIFKNLQFFWLKKQLNLLRKDIIDHVHVNQDLVGALYSFS